MLEEVLKYSKTHSTTVIVALLGVMAVGSIGGTLWIQNLISALAEREHLNSDRLRLVEERYRNRYATLHSRYEVLGRKVSKLVSRVQALNQSVNQLSETRRLDRPLKHTLRNVVADLQNQTEELTNSATSTEGAVRDGVRDIDFAVPYRVPPPPGDTTPPTTPRTLAASAISTSQINLSWNASTDDIGIIGYSVVRCTGASCNDMRQVARGASTTYQDSGLAANTTYVYAVVAFDASGNSSPGATATATTFATPKEKNEVRE